MSVKVVQGLIGDVKAKPSVQPNLTQQNQVAQQQSTAALTSVASQNLYASEAVNVSVRSQRSGSADKIKDYKEAKSVADKTADEIRKSDKAEGAHDGLTSTSGAAHLA